MFKQPKTGWLAIISSLILAALLFAACNADIPAETVPTTAPVETESDAAVASEDTKVISDISDIFVEPTGSSATGNSPTDALPADTEIDVNGVPIGFTENGNPYRGNPNAPVVIEEFSDFQ